MALRDDKLSMQTILLPEKKPAKISDETQVLVVASDGECPDAMAQALGELGLENHISGPQEAIDTLQKPTKLSLVVLVGPLAEDILIQITDRLERLSRPVLLWADEAMGPIKTNNILLRAGLTGSTEMLKGRLAMLLEMQPQWEKKYRELKHLETINQPLNSYFTQVDEEMRLAARIQRDFLPQQLPQIAGMRFGTVFRPATWVSGDIYDILRLDEKHIGVYIADAVGHGMPAALLTMFIKRALVTKEILQDSYRLIEPDEALKHLNEDMVQEGISNSQFATCCYAIINIETLEMRLASAGHPAPMVIDKNGNTEELDVSGSLLGIFENQEYEMKTVQLKRGNKLLIYSDGVELAFVSEAPDGPLRFRKEFEDVAHLPVQTMAEKLLEIIDQEEGSLHPRDDVTIVAVQFD